MRSAFFFARHPVQTGLGFFIWEEGMRQTGSRLVQCEICEFWMPGERVNGHRREFHPETLKDDPGVSCKRIPAYYPRSAYSDWPGRAGVRICQGGLCRGK